MFSAGFFVAFALLGNILCIAAVSIGVCWIFRSFFKQFFQTVSSLDLTLALKQRFMRGEISSEEFHRLKQELESSSQV